MRRTRGKSCATAFIDFCFRLDFLGCRPTHLVLLVAILLPRLGVLTASPGDIGVAGGETHRVVECTEHANSDAHVQRDQLQWQGYTG